MANNVVKFRPKPQTDVEVIPLGKSVNNVKTVNFKRPRGRTQAPGGRKTGKSNVS
jgi:hypothetical protein